MRLRLSLVLIAFGLLVAACGGQDEDRFSLRTPGANTGTAAVVPAAPSPTPTATPKATPKPKPKPKAAAVKGEEKRIIRGWSSALRHGHVAAASRYFSLPSVVQNGDQGGALATRSDVEQFNKTLPCGAKLVKTVRGLRAHWVIGTFVLTDRPGGQCGTGTGDRAYVAFMISQHHITEWIRVEAADANPSATPTPTPTPTPGPSTDSSSVS